MSSKFPGELVESKHIEIFIPEHLEKFQLFILSSIVYYAEPKIIAAADVYSTVTLLARLRGWSTSVPFRTATW